jgi:AcrR family transcriptional regulator
MTANSEVQDVTGRSGAPGDGAPRPMRADAVKNRRRILEAAEATFSTEGVSVPIDTVAERAGVGVGTVYRHFPTKEALFEAIVVTRLEELLEMTRARADADDPGEALFSFLREFAQQASVKQDLSDAMSAAGIDIKSACSVKLDEMMRGIDLLLTRAKSSGAVRLEVSNEEVMGLIVGACKAARYSELDEAICQRMVEIVCDGIRLPSRG